VALALAGKSSSARRLFRRAFFPLRAYLSSISFYILFFIFGLKYKKEEK